MKKIEKWTQGENTELIKHLVERFEKRATAQFWEDEPEMEEPDEDASEEEWDRYSNHTPIRKRSEMQLEFLLGATAAIDFLTGAEESGQSSVHPAVWIFAGIRGEYLTEEHFKPKTETVVKKKIDKQ